ncbi:hypothetical protein KIN20_003371, partial [Parelaphostrongylus tenuis]
SGPPSQLASFRVRIGTTPNHWDWLPTGEIINTKRYCERMDCCNRALSRRRRRNLITLQNNTACCQNEKEVDGAAQGVAASSAVQS